MIDERQHIRIINIDGFVIGESDGDGDGDADETLMIRVLSNGAISCRMSDSVSLDGLGDELDRVGYVCGAVYMAIENNRVNGNFGGNDE